MARQIEAHRVQLEACALRAAQAGCSHGIRCGRLGLGRVQAVCGVSRSHARRRPPAAPTAGMRPRPWSSRGSHARVRRTLRRCATQSSRRCGSAGRAASASRGRGRCGGAGSRRPAAATLWAHPASTEATHVTGPAGRGGAAGWATYSRGWASNTLKASQPLRSEDALTTTAPTVHDAKLTHSAAAPPSGSGGLIRPSIGRRRVQQSPSRAWPATGPARVHA